MTTMFYTNKEYGPECKTTDVGADYKGQLSTTTSGRTCQAWGSQSPHRHTRNNPDKFPDATLGDAGNYCRNPDNTSNGPWCYTTDRSKRWERCSVAKCPEEDADENEEEAEMEEDNSTLIPQEQDDSKPLLSVMQILQFSLSYALALCLCANKIVHEET